MRVAILGAGAAGLMAAVMAARAGAEVTVFEKNEKAGKKLYITGKGRCNVTNASELDECLRHVVRNPRFLYSAFHAFSNRDTMAFFEAEGVPLKVERGNRVFPESEKASDITRALERAAQSAGVRFVYNCPVDGLWLEDGVVKGLAGGRAYDSVILATGGVSYPATGSTGDGYDFARSAGHTVLEARATLVPIETVERWPAELMGLTLKNVTLRAYIGKKKVFEELGELLFAHFGVTGPLVLSASAQLADAPPETARLELDLKPGLNPDKLEARLLRDLAENPRKQLRSVLEGLLPRALAPIVLESCDIPPEEPAHQLTRAQRALLVQRLKALPLRVARLRPVAEAVVTRGGVDVREVDPRSMASKKVPGLFFAGEILDVDATTGGYNLQIAFSTGALAGRSAAAFGAREA